MFFRLFDLDPERKKQIGKKEASHRLRVPPADRQQRREVVLVREARPPSAAQVRVRSVGAVPFESLGDDGVRRRRGGVLPREPYPLVRFPPRRLCLLLFFVFAGELRSKRGFGKGENGGKVERGIRALSLSHSLFSFPLKKKRGKLICPLLSLTCQLAAGGVLHPPGVAVAVQGPVCFHACFRGFLFRRFLFFRKKKFFLFADLDLDLSTLS